MKKLLLLFLFVSVGINAQFNYQAIVKDSDGNPVTNNQVKFKFSLMYQSSTATPVYVEEHDIITPADGVVNLSVGGGTVVNGTFSDMDWSQSVFMKEELDTGNGYQDMGTKQLTTVPYAEYSSGVQGVNLTGENVAVGNNAMKNKDFTSSAGNIAIGEYALQTRTTEISNGSINVAIGYNALKDNRSGDDNVAINKGALEKNNDGNNNIAIGTNSINKNINGGSNIAIGQYSLESSIAASQSIAIGYQAMQYFNNGGEVVNSSNTAIGVYALRGESSTSSNTGRGNTAVGYSSLGNNTTGTGNTAFGKNSLLFNNEGGLNTAIGNGSMYNNTQGIRNTSLGYQSLFNNTQGNYNVTVGYGSGFDNTVGDRLTLIGYNSDTDGESNLTNATAIGADATVTSSNTIQLGNDNVALVNTSGVVSATGFRGSGDEITLTDSGTIVTLLEKITQLEDSHLLGVLKLIISRGIDRNRGISDSPVGQGGQVSIYSTMRDVSEAIVIDGNGGNRSSSNLWRDGEEVFLKVTPDAGYYWYYRDTSSNGTNYSTKNDADIIMNGMSPDNDYYYTGDTNEEFIIKVIPNGNLTFTLDFLQ